LKEIFEAEKNKILTDSDLQKRFAKINKLIKNVTLKEFRDVLEAYPQIISRLNNLDALKKDLWVNYFKKEKTLYNDLIATYQTGKEEIIRIVEKAKEHKSTWHEVVKLFNERFDVPYELKIIDQDDVILGIADAPSISFPYGDKELDKTELMACLSTGEKRALYILNIIFEIEARKNNPKTLLIIDDIADSFDYKNKYAIVEYIKDILAMDNFYAIILTHNFDFYRTIQSRLDIDGGKNCHMTLKTDEKIILDGAVYLNLFKQWSKTVNGNDKILIAAIPFVRNLIEYSQGSDDANYERLTSLLHQKSESPSITVADLKNIYLVTWKTNLLGDNSDKRKVIDLIYTLAGDCSQDGTEAINLENKIILSLAIRLKAEAFMIHQIDDDTFVNAIKKAQTLELLKRYKKDKKNCVDDETKNVLKILGRVQLMTPENIHLNSFMYEPILDMSDSHLKKLYSDVETFLAVSPPVDSTETIQAVA
jgi:hypothetical protein